MHQLHVATIAIGLMLASIPAAWAEGPAFRSREYRDRFVSSLNRQATSNRGDVTVADTTVPHVVIGPQFGSGTHLSVTLGLAGVTASWNQPGVDLLLADDTGRLGPATWGRYTSGDLSNIFVSTGSGTVEASPGGGTCVRAGPDGTLAWIPLNRRLTPAEWTLRLDLVDAVDPAPRLAVAGVEAPRYIADEVIDTSDLKVSDFKELLEKLADSKTDHSRPKVKIYSFGFKYASPMGADYVFDVRFLPNPFYKQELRNLTGEDPSVRDYVMSFAEARDFYDKLLDLLEFVIPQFAKVSKNTVEIAIGCTGGQHRSVTFAWLLNKALKEKGFQTTLKHRDIKRNRLDH